MVIDLTGKVCLVTGASRGVGRGVALGLLEAGATVHITGRTVRDGEHPEGLDRAGSLASVLDESGKHPGRCVAHRVDHAYDVETEGVVRRVLADEGRLDVLVNSAWPGYEHWNSLATGLMAAALPLSFAVRIIGSGTPVAIAFVAVYGLAGGVLAVVRSTMPLDLFPAAADARASSMLALPLNLSFACAPLFAALLAGPGSDAALWSPPPCRSPPLCSLTMLVLRHRRSAALPAPVEAE